MKKRPEATKRVITADDVRAWLRVNGAIKIYGEEAICSPVGPYDHLLFEHIVQLVTKK